MGIFFFNSITVSFYFWFVGQLIFLPCSCTTSAMVSLNLYLLGLLWAYHVLFYALLLPWYHLTCACWASFGPAMYFSFTQFTLPNTSTGLILMQSWASLAHFIPLGILGPFYSFGIIGPFYSYIPMGFCLIFRASLNQLSYSLLLGFVGLCIKPIY